MGSKNRVLLFFIFSVALFTLLNGAYVYLEYPATGIALIWHEIWNVLFYAEIILFSIFLELTYNRYNGKDSFVLDLVEKHKSRLTVVFSPLISILFVLGLANIPQGIMNTFGKLLDSQEVYMISYFLILLSLYGVAAYQMHEIIDTNNNWDRGFYYVLNFFGFGLICLVMFIVAIIPPT